MIFHSLLLACALPALRAAEIVDSNGTVDAPVHNAPSVGLLQIIENARPEQLTLGKTCLPNNIAKDRGEIVEYLCQNRNTSPTSLLPAPNFCEKWATLEKKINGISRATGYPSAVMECTYLIESHFKPGQTSPQAGAKGLCQLMPTTAPDFCRSINSTPELRTMFGNVVKSLGTPEKTCQPAACLGETNDVDSQLLTPAMYYRTYYAAFEKTWADMIERDPRRTQDFYHFLVIGYNGGPGNAIKFMHNVQHGLKDPFAGIPGESRKYADRLDECMTKPNNGSKPGAGNPDCGNLSKGSKACAP